MELGVFLRLWRARWQGGLLIAALCLAVIMAATLAQPLKYSSSLRLLVVQETDGADYYTAARSTEYLSDILSKVSYTRIFFDQVLAVAPEIKADYFGRTNQQIVKHWARSIDVKPVVNTGLLNVTVYHADRGQAEILARAVAKVLIEHNGDYHGLGNKVSLKLLDGPLTSNYPVKPNVVVNALLALLSGVLLSGAVVYWRPQAALFYWFKAVKPVVKTAGELQASQPLMETPVRETAKAAEWYNKF